MMNDDLRAAMAHVRIAQERRRGVEPPFDDSLIVRASHEWRDAVLLRDAYLAEHPVDDEMPIDEAWLRSVGGDSHGTATIWFASSEAGPVYELGICLEGGCDGCVIRQEVGSGHVLVVAVLMPLSRGEFRRLCAALGITLPAAEGEQGK